MTRKTQFIVGEYYHIYNRGANKNEIFLESGDIYYFLDNLIIFNRHERVQASVDKHARKREKQKSGKFEKLVEIVAYALLPNHFHLILKEITPNGISKFMQKIGTSYTMFFNEKYDASGVVFQGTFKARHIIDLVAVSAYVNLNFIHHKYNAGTDLLKTSWFEYIDPGSVKAPICNKNEIDMIIHMSGDIRKYKNDAKQWSKIFVDTHQHNKGFNL